jgi:protein-tyrosine phosphatase
MKILMVCLGNICRSPMAHGLMQHKIDNHPVNGRPLKWEVDSAGTSNWHEGSPPDARSISCMNRHGIDISNQTSRPVLLEDLEEFDLIFVMDKANLADVMTMANTEEQQNKVKLIMSMVYEQTPIDVPDPYFGVGDKGFENVYKMLDEATDKIMEKYAAVNSPGNGKG